MHCFMAASRPTGATANETRVVAPTNENHSRSGLLLEVALETKRVVSLHQHFLIHRAVNRVAGRAAFAHRFMLENKRPALRRVTFRAGVGLRQVRERPAASCVAFVRIVAITATHLPFQHRMVIGEVELPALVEVTLETGLRRLSRIQDRVVRAARFVVNAPRPMARLAAHFVCVRSRRLQARVRCRMEVVIDFLVALRATSRSHKFRPRNGGRNHHCPLHRRAGDDGDRDENSGEKSEKLHPMFFKPTPTGVNPPSLCVHGSLVLLTKSPSRGQAVIRTGTGSV